MKRVSIIATILTAGMLVGLTALPPASAWSGEWYSTGFSPNYSNVEQVWNKYPEGDTSKITRYCDPYCNGAPGRICMHYQIHTDDAPAHEKEVAGLRCTMWTVPSIAPEVSTFRISMAWHINWYAGLSSTNNYAADQATFRLSVIGNVVDTSANPWHYELPIWKEVVIAEKKVGYSESWTSGNVEGDYIIEIELPLERGHTYKFESQVVADISAKSPYGSSGHNAYATVDICEDGGDGRVGCLTNISIKGLIP
jgi:hypothetical protein